VDDINDPARLPLLVMILGPTAAGKSGLAVRLALRFKGEVINGDSMQVYRGFDIGTAKPTPEERAGVPHHLLDFVDPRSQFCAMDFVRDTLRALEGIVGRGSLPFIVGGTGLYLKALLDGLFPGPGRDPELRRRLAREAEENGLDGLWARLECVDPAYAAKVGRRDRVRIIRALEVHELTGAPISAHFARTAGFLEHFQTLRIGLQLDRKELNRRIEERVDRMFAGRLAAEVEGLLAAGVPEDAPPFRALGYKQVLMARRGEVSLDEARELTKRETRQYAKRQVTWFRKMPRVHWLAPDDLEGASGLIRSCL
jgi:tRNA dimethylallyltransferase